MLTIFLLGCELQGLTVHSQNNFLERSDHAEHEFEMDIEHYGMHRNINNI